MFGLNELNDLIKAIDTLQIAEKDDALKNKNKISDLKKVSYELCAYIQTQLREQYPENQKFKMPSFDNKFAESSFDVELLNWYKSHAYYLAYLLNKDNPTEKNNLNNYLTLAEQHGFPFIRVVEFYKEQIELLAKQTATIIDLQNFYMIARANISEQFGIETAKGRFLDLAILITVFRSAQINGKQNNSFYITTLKQKIEYTLGFFKDKLKDNETAKEFSDFFATGAMYPYNSSTAFIEYANSTITTAHPASSANSSSNASAHKKNHKKN